MVKSFNVIIFLNLNIPHKFGSYLIHSLEEGRDVRITERG